MAHVTRVFKSKTKAGQGRRANEEGRKEGRIRKDIREGEKGTGRVD